MSCLAIQSASFPEQDTGVRNILALELRIAGHPVFRYLPVVMRTFPTQAKYKVGTSPPGL
jgi:hypothetical protein